MNTLKVLFAFGAVVGATNLRGLQSVDTSDPDFDTPVEDPFADLDPDTVSTWDGVPDFSGVDDSDGPVFEDVTPPPPPQDDDNGGAAIPVDGPGSEEPADVDDDGSDTVDDPASGPPVDGTPDQQVAPDDTDTGPEVDVPTGPLDGNEDGSAIVVGGGDSSGPLDTATPPAPPGEDFTGSDSGPADVFVPPEEQDFTPDTEDLDGPSDGPGIETLSGGPPGSGSGPPSSNDYGGPGDAAGSESR